MTIPERPPKLSCHQQDVYELQRKLVLAERELELLKERTTGRKHLPTDEDVYEWLKNKHFQTEYGEQEYKMYFDVDMPKIIRMFMKEYNPSLNPSDCYPKEFVEWWFTKGLMEFAIEAFSTPVLFIKFDEGSKRKYTLDELFIYFKDKTK